MGQRASQLKTGGLILYATQSGTTQRLAEQLAAQLETHGCPTQVQPLSTFEVETLWQEQRLVVVALPTYEGGLPPIQARWFLQWLQDSAQDFRVGREALAGLRYAVLGVGHSEYGAQYNQAAKKVAGLLRKMGGQPLVSMGECDEAQGDQGPQLEVWGQRLLAAAEQLQTGGAARAGGVEVLQGEGSGREEGGKASASGGEISDSGSYSSEVSDEQGSEADIEDLGGPAAPRSRRRQRPTKPQPPPTSEPPPMLTPPLRAALTKQGYSLLGTHSGVKVCRWTKAMLRGRGGCYKHTFYGIASHRCMEATPSLACANKCVFCWRHHTNPVGREWRWQVDKPEAIVEEALGAHRRMIKAFGGAPGVKQDRLEEGYAVKHCALSLVGEPIMYPHINRLAALLHERGISTFLVTNAQFPEAIRRLVPVTQLYVSVDAATPETLKAIDRPLFSDSWERLLACLKELAAKRQRTVYRLTLVQQWNMAEVQQYASLLELGTPDFIEVKGVTYCGSSGAASLTLANVPYHDQVRAFGEALQAAAGGRYRLACEHRHSCCVLLADATKFWREGRWHTWIDYDRFQELAAGEAAFSSEDYVAPTPPWALYGSEEAGFSPAETRFKGKCKKKGDPVQVQQCIEAT